jgi:hypothetical protein
VSGFNYLRDAPPEFVDRIRFLRVPRRLHAACSTLVALVVVLGAAVGIDLVREHRAALLVSQAQARFDVDNAAVARRRLAWADVDSLLAADARLRAFRNSGADLAGHLARVGDLLDHRVWLVAVEPDGHGILLRGKAADLPSIHRSMSALLGADTGELPQIVRVTRDDASRSAPLGFELHLGDGR